MSAHPSPQFYPSLVAAPLRAWLKLPDSEDRVPAPGLVTDYWAFTPRIVPHLKLVTGFSAVSVTGS